MTICKPLILSTLLALSASAWCGPGHDHAADHKPQHGGVLTVGPVHYDWELVLKPDRITLHVRNEGKPVPSQGATGKLTLLSGKDKSEWALTPAGDNRLQAVGSFKLAPRSKAVATVTLAGQPPANVRFALP